MIKRWTVFTVGALTAGMLAVAGCTTPTATRTPASVIIAPAAAANMANNCFACHGPRGVSPGSIPTIHIFTAEYLAEALRAFKTDKRPSTVMGRHAKAYSDAELDAIARYIAGLRQSAGGAP